MSLNTRQPPDLLVRHPRTLDWLLTDVQPFGPIDTEGVVNAHCVDADQLFDRTNLIYAQAVGPQPPTYIIGRKGAGKTAFLLGGSRTRPEVLQTATVYSELMAALQQYQTLRGPLFVDQVSDLWHAVFDHVAIAFGCRTATPADPTQLQLMWDYTAAGRRPLDDADTVAEQFLADFQRRVSSSPAVGLRELIDGMSQGGVTFGQARRAARDVLSRRRAPVNIVMDNLEDLHSRLDEVREPLAGLFACAGRLMEQDPASRPYGLHICLPSELFAEIQEISSNPEKDFRGNYLTIYWTAEELLHLAGTRLRLFLAGRHPEQYATLLHRTPAVRPDTRGSEIALLRATLPPVVRGDLRVDEDPVGYLLRHTQLLPRHLLQILNRVYGSRQPGSVPWAVTPAAVISGTHSGEELIVRGILAAHQATYPSAGKVLARLTDKLDVCFKASDLHRVFNRAGIRKLTGLDFGECLGMLFALGVLGVRTGSTGRYGTAHFQYTFDSTLNAHEESSELRIHPLFTRLLLGRALPRLRAEGALPTYPYGCDPAEGDYRQSLGYAVTSGG